MSRKILKMCIGEKEMEINMSGYSDESIDAISTFIDHISDECHKTSTYFNASLYEVAQWSNGLDEMRDVKDKVDKYLANLPYKSTFIFDINYGDNLPFGIAARLRTKAKLDVDAILNMEYNGDGMIGNLYYDKATGVYHVYFKDGYEFLILSAVKEIMEKYVAEDNGYKKEEE